MRRGLALLAVCIAPVLRRGVRRQAARTWQENQVGSTQAAAAATPTGVANCGNYPLARRMSQYVNLVESKPCRSTSRNPIDTICKLSVATLIESVPDCATGTPADRAKADHIAQIARQQIESGVPPDQVYAPDPRRRPRARGAEGLLTPDRRPRPAGTGTIAPP